MMTPKSVKPCVVASSNGNRSKDADGVTCVEKAFKMMTGGADVLDALVAGVSHRRARSQSDRRRLERPAERRRRRPARRVAACTGRRNAPAAVAAIEGVRTPARVAQLVADETDHHLLVGKGAQDFARAMGVKIEDGLINETARKQWLEWKRRTDPLHYLDPKNRAAGVARRRAADGARGADRRRALLGHDQLRRRQRQGEICGVTTTSGLAWKIPGRVGDSPILGAGLYVDGDVGAAGSTGRGEANLYNLCSFLIVEEMRRGAHPKDAAMTALKRVAKNTIEKRLLNARGQPNFGLSFYCLNAKGEYAGVAMYESTYAVCTENGPQTLKTDALFEGQSDGLTIRGSVSRSSAAAGWTCLRRSGRSSRRDTASRPGSPSRSRSRRTD